MSQQVIQPNAGSLNSQAKASAKRQSILKLVDPSKQSRMWLKDVMRKARLLDATHSVRSHWTARNFVEVFDDSDRASVSSSPSQASSLVNEFMDSMKETKSSIKLELDTKATQATPGHAPDVTKVKLEPVLNEQKEQSEQRTDPLDFQSSEFRTPGEGRATARREQGGSESVDTEIPNVPMTPTERVMMMMAEKLTHLSQQFEDLKTEKDKVNNLTSKRKDEHAGAHGLREDWLIDNIIEEAASNQKVWVNSKTGKTETNVENQKRMILNDLIIPSLSMYPIFYDNVIDGDNYQILRNVLVMLNQTRRRC